MSNSKKTSPQGQLLDPYERKSDRQKGGYSLVDYFLTFFAGDVFMASIHFALRIWLFSIAILLASSSFYDRFKKIGLVPSRWTVANMIDISILTVVSSALVIFLSGFLLKPFFVVSTNAYHKGEEGAYGWTSMRVLKYIFTSTLFTLNVYLLLLFVVIVFIGSCLLYPSNWEQLWYAFQAIYFLIILFGPWLTIAFFITSIINYGDKDSYTFGSYFRIVKSIHIKPIGIYLLSAIAFLIPVGINRFVSVSGILENDIFLAAGFFFLMYFLIGYPIAFYFKSMGMMAHNSVTC